MGRIFILLIISCSFLPACDQGESSPGKSAYLLEAENFRHHVDYFNRMEEENIVQAVPNAESWEWMKANIPLFECPQDNFQEMFYFRWWTLRKHIKQTPKGYAMTEFLVNRSYADQYNLIVCALGHHIAESRWLHDPQYLEDNIHVWYRGNEGGNMKKLRAYSSWTAYALYQKFLLDGNLGFLAGMLPDLEQEYRDWESDHRLENGLFWQYDVRDGMEEQISGGRRVHNARPTINSYMYGNALAISKIAGLLGEDELEELYTAKADTLRQLILEKLWNPESLFFETLKENGEFAGVREAIGFIPWYFNIPGRMHEPAWEQVMDEEGFLAPFGLTTAERRHPEFRTHGCCNCEWDGAVWPFASAQTLTGMANLLNGDKARMLAENSARVNDSVFFRLMELYVESQYYRGRPYIGEYLDESTGYWLKGDQERSRYYNHSTFNDLMITGIVGFRPREDGRVEVNPLIPEGRWEWFCLDRVLYQEKIITVFWDRDGTRYGRGAGLHVWVDGKEAAFSPNLEKVISQ